MSDVEWYKKAFVAYIALKIGEDIIENVKIGFCEKYGLSVAEKENMFELSEQIQAEENGWC